jgi:hypothetical protein
MAIFVIFRVADPEKMRAAVARVYPGNHLNIQTDEWLVSDVGTAQEVSTKLGVTLRDNPTQTETGPAMVFSMAGYYGRATTEIWDWIKAKAEAPGG